MAAPVPQQLPALLLPGRLGHHCCWVRFVALAARTPLLLLRLLTQALPLSGGRQPHCQQQLRQRQEPQQRFAGRLRSSRAEQALSSCPGRPALQHLLSSWKGAQLLHAAPAAAAAARCQLTKELVLPVQPDCSYWLPLPPAQLRLPLHADRPLPRLPSRAHAHAQPQGSRCCLIAVHLTADASASRWPHPQCWLCAAW